MNRFGVLMRLNIRNRLAALRGGGLRDAGGKFRLGRLMGGILMALAYLMILAMIVGMEFLLFEGLKAVGQPELLLSLSMTVVMAGMVFMSLFYVLTALYYGRDTVFLASLPASSRTIFGAKLTEVLLGETGMAAVALLPAIILYGLHVGAGVGYYLSAAAVVLCSAMIPVAVTALLATLIVRLTGGSRHREAVMMVYTTLVMVVVLGVEFSLMGSIPADAGYLYFIQLLVNKQAMMRMVSQAFPPSWWAMQGLMGSVGHLLAFVACAVGVLALVWMLLGRSYLSICLSLTENSAGRRRRGRAMRTVRAHTPLYSLYLKEWREVLRSPTYAVNSLSSVIMIPAMVVGMLIGGMQGNSMDSMGEMLNMMRMGLAQAPMTYLVLGMTALMAFACFVNPAVDTAVSREGKRFVISRMLPVSPRIQLLAKLLMGMSLNLAPVLVGAVLLGFLLPDLLPAVLLALLLTQVCSLGMSAFGLLLDAMRPNLHWTNEMQAIKQNKNVGVGMLISLLLIAAPVAAFFLTIEQSMALQTAAVLLVCLLEAVAGVGLLLTLGARRFAALEDEV